MVGPFRIERLIGAGSVGAVYEATQVSLRRAVALRLIDADHFKTPEQLVRFDQEQRLAAALHHPNLVPCYEVGEWEGGRFIAMRLFRGRTVAQLRKDGSPPTASSLEPLGGALRAMRGAGLAHGRVSENNILMEADGVPYLADLGLARGTGHEADERALADVVSRLPTRDARVRARRTRLRLAPAGLAIAAAAAAAVAMSGGDDPAPAGSGTLGCVAEPSANTPACTLAQLRLGGRTVTVNRPGVIRSWEVDGASGDVALQVIREQGGRSHVVGFSQPERLTGPVQRAFPAEIPVQTGDQIGVLLGPGASIGVGPAPPGSAIVRWDGGLTAGPQGSDGATPGRKLMLSVEIEFGARAEGPRQLFGAQAAAAPAGQPLAEVPVPLSGGRAARAVVVDLPGGIAVDLFAGGRLARLAVPDADPAGDLLELAQNCGPIGIRGFCLRWQNPGEELALMHEYRVRGSGRIKLIG